MKLETKNQLSTLTDSVSNAESILNKYLRHQSSTASADPTAINIDRAHTAVHALWRLTAIRKTIPTLTPHDQLTLEPIDVSSLTDSTALAEQIFNLWLKHHDSLDPSEIQIDRVNTTIHALYRLASIRKTLPEIKSLNCCRTFKEIGDRARLARQVSDLARKIERRAKEEFDVAHPRHPDDDDDVPFSLDIYRDNGLSDEDYYEDLEKIENDEDDDLNDADEQSDFSKQLKRFKKLSACVEARRASISRCPRFRSPLAQTLHNTIGMIAKLPDSLYPPPQPETETPQQATSHAQQAPSNPQRTTNNKQRTIPKSAITNSPP